MASPQTFDTMPLPHHEGRPSGVNIAGYLSAELGVGEVARGYMAALASLGAPLTYTDFALGTASPKGAGTPAAGATEAATLNLVCVNADQMPGFAAYAGADFFKGRRNIGAWSWELPEFPAAWDDRFAPFDEIWVGSTYMQTAIARRSPNPSSGCRRWWRRRRRPRGRGRTTGFRTGLSPSCSSSTTSASSRARTPWP